MARFHDDNDNHNGDDNEWWLDEWEKYNNRNWLQQLRMKNWNLIYENLNFKKKLIKTNYKIVITLFTKSNSKIKLQIDWLALLLFYIIIQTRWD